MMQIDAAQILGAARATVEDPRRAARFLVAQNIAPEVAFTALTAVAVCSALLSSLVMLMMGGAGPLASMPPLAMAALQVLVLGLGGGVMHGAARAFGGTARLGDHIAALAWIEFILLILQAIQILALVILPPAALMLALFGIGLTFYLAVHFLAEMNGFASRTKVFFGIIGVGAALMIVLAMVLGAFLPDLGV